MGAWELAGAVVGVLVGGATILSFLAGVIWWMSSLYHEVKGIRKEGKDTNQLLRETAEALWRKVDAHGDTLTDHSVRIVILEEWRDQRDHENHG